MPHPPRASSTQRRWPGRTPGIYSANGLWQIGPMIIKWGTDEQRDRWIPNILNADDHWCQGFSEPGESDLANLAPPPFSTATSTSSTVRRSGSPPPTSPSGACSSCGPTPPSSGDQARGITALIVDMEVEGIECRPIRDIAGDEMFNEVFFTDARVPADYRLGDEGGLAVAMGTLGRERVGTAGLAITMQADLDAMISLARSENPEALEDRDP